LDVGCTATAVSFTDSSSFSSTGVLKYVGDSTAGVYTFSNPTVSRSYCGITKNEIVETDGTTLSNKLVACASQPCTEFALASTGTPETITFKVRTTVLNGITHLSPQVTTQITCGSSYSITASSAITETQNVAHGDAAVGFNLKAFTHAHSDACPINNWELSTSNSAVSAPSGLSISTASGSGSSSVKIIKPSDTSLHQAYTFYVKVSADGGSSAWFGPYTLNVGCFSGSFSIANSASFINQVNKNLNSATTNAYTMHNPSSN
jgi:hypothetical protein